jgi:hypothetical protein
VTDGSSIMTMLVELDGRSRNRSKVVNTVALYLEHLGFVLQERPS